MFVFNRGIHRCLTAALLAASLGAQAQTAITVDGHAADWTGVPVLASASGQAAQSIKAVASGGYLYVVVQGQQLAPNYNLYINTDNNAATGYQASNSWATSGADFLVSGGALLRSTGTGWSWASVDTRTTDAAGGVAVSANASVIEARIPLAALGLTASTAGGISLGIQNIKADWSLDSVLPKASALARLTPVARPAGPSFPVGKGLIIPAYLTLDYDAANWNLLKEGAALFTAANNPVYKDFWVAVNSGNNGPFQNQADWAKAKVLWDPIRANGGRIFGYIHTVQSPDINLPEGRKYRSLDVVKAEVTAWVQGYPALDGIWIDEFYPRYEIAGPGGTDTPDYPNGASLAPASKSYIDPATGKFNWTQVNPAGGYYSQLTSWIRATYPQLRLIGNAGGNLYSNQYKYGDLVDVLVSFEETVDTAYVTGRKDWVNGAVVETERYQWHGLDRQNTVTTAPGQLALIHGNSSNMALAIDQALSHGYTHVYTTDRVLNNNIWGGVPGYLTSEIQYLSSRR